MDGWRHCRGNLSPSRRVLSPSPRSCLIKTRFLVYLAILRGTRTNPLIRIMVPRPASGRLEQPNGAMAPPKCHSMGTVVRAEGPGFLSCEASLRKAANKGRASMSVTSPACIQAGKDREEPPCIGSRAKLAPPCLSVTSPQCTSATQSSSPSLLFSLVLFFLCEKRLLVVTPDLRKKRKKARVSL